MRFSAIPRFILICLAGAPSMAGAADECQFTSEAAFVEYVNRLAVGLNSAVDYRYSEGAGGGMSVGKAIIPAERPFVRGAAAITEGDLFLTVQFDRNGSITDVDVRRHIDQAEFEILARMFGACLDPYKEQLAALDSYITGHVQYQIAEEAARKAKLAE